MSVNAFTEDTLVQQTTAEYLERQLGWESVYAYNAENFGPDGLQGRKDDREVLLTRYLRAALVEFNPGLPVTAYDEAVRQIVTTVATQTLPSINREKHELIKDGVQVIFRNSKGVRVRQLLRLEKNLKRDYHIITADKRLKRLLEQNPLRTNFQRHYEQIVAEYNREKDRAAIEKTFADLLFYYNELDAEDSRAVREGLDEESLAIYDLLKKQDLSPSEIRRIKAVAAELLDRLKAEKLRIDHWRDKESTRDAVRIAIRDFLWSDASGLPVDSYTGGDVHDRAEDVFRHVYRVYPTVPSPFYGNTAAA